MVHPQLHAKMAERTQALSQIPEDIDISDRSILRSRYARGERAIHEGS